MMWQKRDCAITDKNAYESSNTSSSQINIALVLPGYLWMHLVFCNQQYNTIAAWVGCTCSPLIWVKELHANELSVSYNEIRRVHTSIVGCNWWNKELEYGEYVLSGIILISQGGALVQWGDYNIGVNTKTIDDKNTFHQMGTIIL